MNQQNLKHLQALIANVRVDIFEADYHDKVSDEEVLGLMVSQYFQWDGDAVYKVAREGFEDCNYHTFNAEFARIWAIEDVRCNGTTVVELFPAVSP